MTTAVGDDDYDDGQDNDKPYVVGENTIKKKQPIREADWRRWYRTHRHPSGQRWPRW